MLKELDNYDWEEVFKYARPEICEGYTGTNKEFDREDVEFIYSRVEGINDEENWSMIGKLKDSRVFYISAGCDYTGWG